MPKLSWRQSLTLYNFSPEVDARRCKCETMPYCQQTKWNEFMKIHPVGKADGKSPICTLSQRTKPPFWMGISQPNWWLPKCRHTDFHQPPLMAPFSRAMITAVSYPWLVRNMRQPVISNIPQTYPKHSSTISKLALETDSCAAWKPWEATCFFVWRIIPRIRTGLKPFDHQIHHHRGWTPSYRCTKPAWDLTICHYLRSKTYLAPVGRLTKQLRELVNFVYPRGENKKLRPTGGDAENQLGGKLVDAGGSMLTASARPSIPGFWSCELLQLEHFIRFQCSRKIVQCLDERGFIVKAGTLSIPF